MEAKYKAFIQRYFDTLTPDKAAQYISFSADYFCADEHNANLCADLIMLGQKRASCSMAHWYQVEGETLPRVGHLQVVTNWQGEAVCIIEITDVRECRYNQVDAEFAALEGEGDQSLSWWREAHWRFFAAECGELGIEPSEDMLLILEQFRCVYPTCE